MNKCINRSIFLFLLMSTSSFAQDAVVGANYWQCTAQDQNKTQWISKSSYQKIASNFSYATCKKNSKNPATCKTSLSTCIRFVGGLNITPSWECTAFDREALAWKSNFYPNKDDAALGALAYCKHKSSVPLTCSINVVTCMNRNEI